MDRNPVVDVLPERDLLSLSARRAWIEIGWWLWPRGPCWVALRKESVDRNTLTITICIASKKSLSARRAWIEIFSVREVFANFEGSLSARRAWIEISFRFLWC